MKTICVYKDLSADKVNRWISPLIFQNEKLEGNIFILMKLSLFVWQKRKLLLLTFLQDITNTTSQVSILIVSLVILLVLFLGTHFPLFQQRQLSLAWSLFVISTLMITIFLCAHLSAPSRPGDYVVPVFILLFVVNAMLPVSISVAIVISVVLVAIHLLLTILLSHESTENLYTQVSLIVQFFESSATKFFRVDWKPVTTMHFRSDPYITHENFNINL